MAYERVSPPCAVDLIWAIAGVYITDNFDNVPQFQRGIIIDHCTKLGIHRGTIGRQLSTFIRFKGNRDAARAFERTGVAA